MRRTGHIRERTPGGWEVRYSLGRDPATGKRRVGTATVRGTRKEAERELRRLLRTIDTNEHVDSSRMTTREWLTAWLRVIRDEVSPKSHERYCEIVFGFLVPELDALPLARLAPTHIQAAYTKWAIEGRRDGKLGGLSPRTRRHIHRILRASPEAQSRDTIIVCWYSPQDCPGAARALDHHYYDGSLLARHRNNAGKRGRPTRQSFSGRYERHPEGLSVAISVARAI